MELLQLNYGFQIKDMFAVIYRGYVKAGCEPQYQKAWHQVAKYFIEKRGAIGSCLHRTSDGLWLAYSRWPDKKTRDASWPEEGEPSSVLPYDIREAILIIKHSIDQERKLPDIHMEIIDDLLLK